MLGAAPSEFLDEEPFAPRRPILREQDRRQQPRQPLGTSFSAGIFAGDF